MHKPARVVLSGSAAELGPVDPEHLPVDETYTGYPRDAYGRSKYLATSAGLAERSPLEVMVARVFNPIGPGTPPTQAFGRFADRLDRSRRRSAQSRGRRPRRPPRFHRRARRGPCHDRPGVARSRRAWPTTWAPADRAALAKGSSGSIQLSGRAVRVSVDPALQSRRGPVDSRANIDRITTHTDWRPSISWEQSIDDLWREVDARKRPRRADQVAAA